MRTVEEIITDLKHNIYWSQPNIKFNELSALVAELENTLSSPEVIVEETIVEETVVEETITEEPVVVKKTTRKK
jgi:hypothetical protein